MARVERIRDYLARRRRLPGQPRAPSRRADHRARRRARAVRALAEVAPAPYGALIEADGVTVISGSPERFLASVGDRVETRPIKGTRPRTPGGAEELAAADKDAAEHLMIVDLERNDLGRVAETGSVRVDELGYVVELPGALSQGVAGQREAARRASATRELLRATFPGGSITGAPKVRAMQIIDELEPARRGPYCGAFGYFGADGAFELAIAIRIGVLVGHELRVHVGGGIVADSDPAAELAETEVKAAGWVAALARLARTRDQVTRSNGIARTSTRRTGADRTLEDGPIVVEHAARVAGDDRRRRVGEAPCVHRRPGTVAARARRAARPRDTPSATSG